ncbi:chemotaxis protein [Clostridium sp. D2Q-11]|uniref:Chemotaxis protein n=2 Tax=Anaeromonas frigoriresistens TaxID=2683708 RepID=A0A942UVX4_9FIRM|nr:chemotaxis protein [Anaeromonas frigoriresistens]
MLKRSSLIVQAMESGERKMARVGKELFGVPYIGVAIPIKDENGDVIGGAFFGENTSRQDVLRDMSSNLAENTNYANESSQEINAQAEELAALGQQLSQVAADFNNQLKSVDTVINFIKDISSQTNLLGLNATIEAARVGQEGRGFQVVAEEIRKLSKQSNESADKIEEMLKKIKKDSSEITQTVNTVEDISGNLAGIIQSMSASIEGINSMVEELYDMSEKLVEEN